MASPFPSLVDPGSVQIQGEVKTSKNTESVTTSNKTTPTKIATKKKLLSKSSSEMPVLQSTRLVSHMISSQAPTGRKVLPTASVSFAAQQDPNSHLVQQAVRGSQPFMGLHQIPKFASSASSLDDNLFASPRAE